MPMRVEYKDTPRLWRGNNQVSQVWKGASDCIKCKLIIEQRFGSISLFPLIPPDKNSLTIH